MLNAEQRNKLNELRKQERYLDIFNTFGINVFYRVTPKNARKRIMDFYIKNNNRQMLSTMFKKKDAKYALSKATDYAELKSEPNKVIGAVKYTGKRFMHSKVAPIAITALLIQLSWTGLVKTFLWGSYYNQKTANAQEYAMEIEEYNYNVENYAQYLNLLNLSDIEVMTKIMSDMWTNIEGYGSPDLNLSGYGGLDVSASDGQGVCRNMAADMVNKLNAYNPDYNARCLYVDMSYDGEYHLMDIDRNIMTSEQASAGAQEQFEDSSFLQKYAANHVVVALEVPGHKGTLLVDITNPSFGILDDGKIHWINSEYTRDGKPNNENPKTYTYKANADFEMGDNHLSNTLAIINSYITPQSDINRLLEEYSLENQDQALANVEALNDHDWVSQAYYSGSVDEIAERHDIELPASIDVNESVESYTRSR